MRKFILILLVGLISFGCGPSPPTPDEIAAIDSTDAVLIDSLINFIEEPILEPVDKPVGIKPAPIEDNTAAKDSSSVIVISGDSPVIVADTPSNDVKATEYTVTFVASPVNSESFKVSVVISGVEDVGSFVAFKFDSSIPDSLHYDGMLPGTDGVTNGWAGIATQADDQNWKYGRVGGYASSGNPGKISGVLVDMYYSGPIEFAVEIVYFDMEFNFDVDNGYGLVPLALHPQINLERQLVKPEN